MSCHNLQLGLNTVSTLKTLHAMTSLLSSSSTIHDIIMSESGLYVVLHFVVFICLNELSANI